MKALLTLPLLLLMGFAQDTAKVPATNEQSLEVSNLLLTVQAKQQEARALRAEATLAEQEAAKLNERVKPMLDSIMDNLKLDKSQYVPIIENNKLAFVLKPVESPKP